SLAATMLSTIVGLHSSSLGLMVYTLPLYIFRHRRRAFSQVMCETRGTAELLLVTILVTNQPVAGRIVTELPQKTSVFCTIRSLSRLRQGFESPWGYSVIAKDVALARSNDRQQDTPI